MLAQVDEHRLGRIAQLHERGFDRIERHAERAGVAFPEFSLHLEAGRDVETQRFIEGDRAIQVLDVDVDVVNPVQVDGHRSVLVWF